jgi:putative inorganic carbon (HCO3(-)) transporter
LASLRSGWTQLKGESPFALPALAAVAAIVGLGVQGATDTIFFRPEVQLTGWFCLATLAVSGNGVPSAADPQVDPASEAP